jgi:hypothetical protein
VFESSGLTYEARQEQLRVPPRAVLATLLVAVLATVSVLVLVFSVPCLLQNNMSIYAIAGYGTWIAVAQLIVSPVALWLVRGLRGRQLYSWIRWTSVGSALASVACVSAAWVKLL